MKIVQIAAGQTEYRGHILYAVDDQGQLWSYSPRWLSTMGGMMPDRWERVRQLYSYETAAPE